MAPLDFILKRRPLFCDALYFMIIVSVDECSLLIVMVYKVDCSLETVMEYNSMTTQSSVVLYLIAQFILSFWT